MLTSARHRQNPADRGLVPRLHRQLQWWWTFLRDNALTGLGETIA